MAGFDGDPVDYVVINWSRTGMLLEYDGPLVTGDYGTLVRLWIDERTGMEAVKPRRFQVVRQRGLETAVDFIKPAYLAGFDLAEGNDRGEEF